MLCDSISIDWSSAFTIVQFEENNGSSVKKILRDVCNKLGFSVLLLNRFMIFSGLKKSTSAARSEMTIVSSSMENPLPWEFLVLKIGFLLT